MKITWVSADGKRQRKSRSTRLISRGNKKRAQDMLNDFIREKQSELSVNGDSGKDVLFTDYMKQWLAKMQPQIRKTTYSGYHDSVNKIIVPYFEPLGLKLSEVTPKHIQDFYTEQLERVKGTSVKAIPREHSQGIQGRTQITANWLKSDGVCGSSKKGTISRSNLYC